jgi:hypothetical protein
MTTLATREVGRLWVPEFDRLTFLPGRTTAQRRGYQAIVTIAVRDGQTGHTKQAQYAAGMVTLEGLRDKWAQTEALQREFRTPEAMVARMQRGLIRQAAVAHNERTLNGARMVAKTFWGLSPTMSNATVNTPNRIALGITSSTYTYTDQSLASASANVTTNEATTNGMSRTGALTPSQGTEPASFDAQDTITISNTFTDTTGASTIVGAGLVDNTTGAFNLFSEATFTSATLQINDTLAVTWTVKF